LSAAGWGTGTQTGSGDPTTRDPIKRFTIGADKPLKRASELSEKERVWFSFNPTAPEEWRSTAPVVMQLYATGVMSLEESRERLALGPVKKGETFYDPTQMTPGQANKITTNPRKTGGVDNPKGVVSKPPEQQEKPEEVASGTAGVSMPQLVSGEPAIQPLGTPKKKKAKERKWQVKAGEDVFDITEKLSD